MDPVILNSIQEYMDGGGLLDVRAMRPYVGMKHNANEGGAFHRNALLRRYEWETIDAAVLDVMRQPLVGISDLVNRGLTKPLGGLGAIISTYEQLGDMTDADISMDVTPKKGEDDRATFTPISLPVPIISKPFTLSLRHLEASRKMGGGLDVTQTTTATIKVRQALENLLFNGTSKKLQTFSIYGYTTAPHRLTKTAAQWGGGDFGTSQNGHKTIVAMITGLRAAGFYGPYGCYISPAQYAQLLALVGTTPTETELSIILRTIPDLQFVKASNSLADGKMIIVQLTSDVVDLAVAQDTIPVQWAEEGGMIIKMRVLTAAVPRIKYDANDACGVAEATSC
jgi:uncharacterized linocin/CFP29 family protein